MGWDRDAACRLFLAPRDSAHTTWYNFAHTNSAVRVSPHCRKRLWDVTDIVKLIEGWDAKIQ
jgi:hypothetical protein